MAEPALKQTGRPPEKSLTASLVARRWLVLRKVPAKAFSDLVQAHDPDVVVCFTQADTDVAELAVAGTRAQVLRVWPESMRPRLQQVGSFQLAAFRHHQRSLLDEDLSAAPAHADIIWCPYRGDPLAMDGLREYIAQSAPVLCVRGTEDEASLTRRAVAGTSVNVLQAHHWAAVEINGSECRLIAAN